MNAAEKILKELVETGKVSFDEEDLKGRSSAEQKLLIRLGAVNGIKVQREIQNLFTNTDIKRLIASDIPLDMRYEERIIKFLYSEEISNFNNIFKINVLPFILNEEFLYFKKKLISNLKTWKKVKKGRDLRISKFGKIDIVSTMDFYLKSKENIRNNYYRFEQIPSVKNFQIYAYFKDEIKKDSNAHSLISRFFIKKNMPLLLWVKENKFPISRIDELNDALIIGLFNYNLNLKSVLNILNDIIERNLSLTWKDKLDFEYNPKVLKVVDKYNLTYPKNGIELKRQAKKFKNCAGSYVNKIHNKETMIVYNDSMMIELPFNGGIIKQSYASTNRPIMNQKDLEILEKFKEEILF